MRWEREAVEKDGELERYRAMETERAKWEERVVEQLETMKREWAGCSDNWVFRDKLVTVEGQLGVMRSEIGNYKMQISQLVEEKSSLMRDKEQLI